MIPFEQAYNIVMDQAYHVSNERVSLPDSLNRILAEDIHADMDIPSFNKSAVDGFACRKADLTQGIKDSSEIQKGAPLIVVETIPAGTLPTKSVFPGQCSRIMTGSMVPEGADCVIMVEDTKEREDERIIFTGNTIPFNIRFKGEDIKTGERVMDKGTLIRPQHIAVLASVGAVNPLVAKKVRTGILSTGDELVEPEFLPQGSKIRNSNAWQLIAQATNSCCQPEYHGIALDSTDFLISKVEEAFAGNDVVILTGGVSMGDFDYVPEVLKRSGFEILFKSIAIQPGRPTVFGTRGKKAVFALPGNPVSSFVLFELLVKPFLYKMMGLDYRFTSISLPMGETCSRKKSTRKSLLPVKIINGEVRPLEYHGSAHINAYVEADGIISMEIGSTKIEKGELVNVRQI